MTRCPAVPPAGIAIVPVLVSVSVLALAPFSVRTSAPLPVRVIVPALV